MKTMHPQINAIIVAVDDLERSRAFYQDLGWPGGEVRGAEFPATERDAAGKIVRFALPGGQAFILYPRRDQARDAGVHNPPEANAVEFVLEHNVRSRQEVDEVMRHAEAAGATITSVARERPWGIYSGYFQDPDGHLWQITHDPRLRTELA